MSPKEIAEYYAGLEGHLAFDGDKLRTLSRSYLDLLKRHENLVRAARNTLNRQTDYQARWAMEEISDALKQLDSEKA